jgi:hypothetical protein
MAFNSNHTDPILINILAVNFFFTECKIVKEYNIELAPARVFLDLGHKPQLCF